VLSLACLPTETAPIWMISAIILTNQIYLNSTNILIILYKSYIDYTYFILRFYLDLLRLALTYSKQRKQLYNLYNFILFKYLYNKFIKSYIFHF